MKPEVKSLLEKAQESRDAAELLRQESYPDFAASRAYYALFYTAKLCCWSEDLPSPAETPLVDS
jgi:uncharacterized protein (UPF0332 family)